MIFYYTATGNSLFVARHIEKNPISIPQELKKENLNYEDEIIGIVAPIYAGELPKTVRKFIEKANFQTKYFYLLLTYGNKDSVASVWSEQFCLKKEIHVDYIQTIQMVDNYLPSFDMQEQMSIDKKENLQIQEALCDIQLRKKKIPQPTQEGKELYERVRKRFQEHPELNNGETIMMSERCSGCGICTKVCPIGNIVLEKGKAKRLSQICDFCLACVHNCPFHAIELRIDKNPDVRYRHQDITLKDIVNANQQGGKR